MENSIVEELINKFENFLKNNISLRNGDERIATLFVKELKREYGLLPAYPTLREYINDHSAGAYHNFIFKINGITVDVIGTSDFERTFQPHLLDEYVVVSDNTKEFGGNCENYECKHYLTVERR